MTLRLLPASLEIAAGMTRSFVGFGGAEPYSYSVIGAGSVESDGTYTAPSVVPSPKNLPIQLQVQDANGDTAVSDIIVATPLVLLALIIQRELGLQDGRVYLWDQKINSPTDEGIFVAISALSPKCYGNTNEFDPANNTQVQNSNWATLVDIDIISRGPEARDRKEEVVMALKSQYSIQQQEANSFSIASIPSAIRNLSEIDGAAIPYRFNFSVNLTYNVKKIQPADYFNTFQSPPDLLIDP